jgi:hypothetical protein
MSTTKPQPDVRDLQSGDFLWCKHRGETIAYLAAQPGDISGEAPGSDAAIWNEQKAQYLEALESDGQQDTDHYRYISRLTYLEFVTGPWDGQLGGPTHARWQRAALGAPGLLGLHVSVGHMAIVLGEGAGALVVEAIPRSYTAGGPDGVTVTPYAAWQDYRHDMLVWHGRLAGQSEAMRSAVATEAGRQQGRPYRFFEFNLLDDSGFYCSKLAWFATWVATRCVALDDRADPDRHIWYSPKQAMHSRHIDLLNVPAPY